MANFTVRVELHGATSEHYAALHQKMQNANFKQTISGIDASGGKGWWKLPTAEYDFESELTCAAVRDSVKVIADSVKIGAWVLVTQVAERSWTTAKVSSS